MVSGYLGTEIYERIMEIQKLRQLIDGKKFPSSDYRRNALIIIIRYHFELNKIIIIEVIKEKIYNNYRSLHYIAYFNATESTQFNESQYSTKAVAHHKLKTNSMF